MLFISTTFSKAFTFTHFVEEKEKVHDEEEEIDEVGGIRATTDSDDFVKQIKADAAEAPTVEETIPEGADE